VKLIADLIALIVLRLIQVSLFILIPPLLFICIVSALILLGVYEAAQITTKSIEAI